MEVRQLEALRAVRAQDGVTAAAAVLHLTPSAVSQQLAALQRDVGVPLTRQVAIVRSLVDHVQIGPGRRGARSLELERVDIVWRP